MEINTINKLKKLSKSLYTFTASVMFYSITNPDQSIELTKWIIWVGFVKVRFGCSSLRRASSWTRLGFQNQNLRALACTQLFYFSFRSFRVLFFITSARENWWLISCCSVSLIYCILSGVVGGISVFWKKGLIKNGWTGFLLILWFFFHQLTVTSLGLVPRMMVKFNPGLSQIFSKVFLSKNM